MAINKCATAAHCVCLRSQSTPPDMRPNRTHSYMMEMCAYVIVEELSHNCVPVVGTSSYATKNSVRTFRDDRPIVASRMEAAVAMVAMRLTTTTPTMCSTTMMMRRSMMLFALLIRRRSNRRHPDEVAVATAIADWPVHSVPMRSVGKPDGVCAVSNVILNKRHSSTNEKKKTKLGLYSTR